MVKSTLHIPTTTTESKLFESFWKWYHWTSEPFWAFQDLCNIILRIALCTATFVRPSSSDICWGPVCRTGSFTNRRAPCGIAHPRWTGTSIGAAPVAKEVALSSSIIYPTSTTLFPYSLKQRVPTWVEAFRNETPFFEQFGTLRRIPNFYGIFPVIRVGSKFAIH